jgi:DNA-binding winged helix-turn-helix (wHTH) protein
MAEVKIDLAHEPDIKIGPLTISPSTRKLIRNGSHITLENRVMQALVVLRHQNAAVVSRDELIAACWEGRFVSDDAINQVISRLRRALAEIGGDVLAIETLSKIGYRLYPVDAPEKATPWPEPAHRQPLARRPLLVGAAGLLGAAALGKLAWRQMRNPVSAEILTMMDQSRQLMGQNTREGQNQGIGILRNVVAREPGYADGWGRLGIAYGVVSHYREKDESDELRDRAEAAARRTLQIEPNNALGEMAFSVALPFIGHYLEREQHQNRALALDPNNYDVLIYTAVTLQFVGRNADAVELYRRLPKGPVTPAEYNNFLKALWSADLIEEADQVFARALSLYPTQATLWLTKLQMLLYCGHHREAIAMASDPRSAPTSLNPELAKEFIAMAQALESKDQQTIDTLITAGRKEALQAAYRAENVIRDACAYGRPDEAFELADAYYFNRGHRIPVSEKPGSTPTLDQRQTRLLFEPVTAPMRADPRFAELMRALRFDAYWAKSGHRPDYFKSA